MSTRIAALVIGLSLVVLLAVACGIFEPTPIPAQPTPSPTEPEVVEPACTRQPIPTGLGCKLTCRLYCS